jgi:hypothetical protein
LVLAQDAEFPSCRYRPPAALCGLSGNDIACPRARLRFMRRCACAARPRQRLITDLWCLLDPRRKTSPHCGCRTCIVCSSRSVWTTTLSASIRLKISKALGSYVKPPPVGQFDFARCHSERFQQHANSRVSSIRPTNLCIRIPDFSRSGNWQRLSRKASL